MINAENENTPIYKRKIADINSGNISDLRTVEEGWFVEFKSALQDSAKTAKSLSAFANGHGGILVIGVEEDNKTRKMNRFKPISQNEANEVIVKIRQAADAHLMPCPLFFPKAIEVVGESDSSENGWVVVIEVPKGENGPYLHGNGVVYIRKGDSSSPVALNDIGLMERIWQGKEAKAREMEGRVGFLCDRNGQKYPRIDFFVKVAEKEIQQEKVTFDAFRRIAQRTVSEGSGKIFDGFYPLDSSYVARMSRNGFYGASLVWDFDHERGLHHVKIPIATHLWLGTRFDAQCLGNDRLSVLSDYLLQGNMPGQDNKILIVDVGFSLYLMSVVLDMIISLHGRDNPGIQFRANARAAFIKNSIPFVNVPGYGEYLKASTPPFIHRDIDFLYRINGVDDWLLLEKRTHAIDDFNVDVTNSFLLFIAICKAVGIDKSILVKGDAENLSEDCGEYIIDLFTSYLYKGFSFTCIENNNA